MTMRPPAQCSISMMTTSRAQLRLLTSSEKPKFTSDGHLLRGVAKPDDLPDEPLSVRFHGLAAGRFRISLRGHRAGPSGSGQWPESYRLARIQRHAVCPERTFRTCSHGEPERPSHMECTQALGQERPVRRPRRRCGGIISVLCTSFWTADVYRRPATVGRRRDRQTVETDQLAVPAPHLGADR